MLSTPLGAMKLFINGEEVGFTAIKLDLELHCPDVSGRYLIQYEYKNEMKNQEIKCCIPSLDVKGDVESGENLEAISFYKNDIKLTIGVEGEFTDDTKYIDYSGEYLSNGIQYVTYHTSVDRKFNFGVSWIQPWTEGNDIQTWFGADPTLIQNV
ncbi:hypothetical protein [Psychrobacillus lasiicapitis]|uniref:Uncharacterized protein n=1 Tax=Psychrobacillus lasiicapitis TaxID=1636719 RepID=A0A544STE3_9BACI|nr:hypothetical protein [Psychrobacillus lasiicapitis]TQR08494.1 hypothetical protein FG382_21350 [Psychrobacillus lasiicapitis]GGA15455.1 hypothetical protein GCM10011384_00190 [Psychrobacillus lasiicapitis]